MEQAQLERCRVGGPRVHLKKAGASTSLCGREVRGVQRNLDTGGVCLDCTSKRKEIDLAEPPAPPQIGKYAAVQVKTKTPRYIHLAERVEHEGGWPKEHTLCGRRVGAIIAQPSGEFCMVCLNKSASTTDAAEARIE